MNRQKLIAFFVIAIALFAGITTTVVFIRENNTNIDSQVVKSADYFSFTAEENKTVLEQLQKHAAVQVEQSGYGAVVTSINGVGPSNGKHWVYYVDGVVSTVGAGDYVTTTGQKIEWKLE